MPDKPKSDPASEGAAAAQPKGRKVLVIGAAVTILLAAAGGGAFYFLGSAGHSAKGATTAKPPRPEPIYSALDPPFVVNFEANGLVRFLQVTVQAMSRDPATIDLIKRHDPVIRNSLLMLFSGQSYEKLSSTQGKEALRRAALEAVRKVVAAEGGKGALVEDLYFTSFVMQ